MVLRSGLVVMVAACMLVASSNVPAGAEDAKAAPEKVPFSAFRIKPILDRLHTETVPEKYKLKLKNPAPADVAPKPALAVKPLAAAAPVKPTAKPTPPPETARPETTQPEAARSETPRPEPVAVTAPAQPEEEPRGETISAFIRGIPIPIAKPATGGDGTDMVGMEGAYVPPERSPRVEHRTAGIERIPAEIVESGSLPRPPEQQVPEQQAEERVQEEEPRSSVRIRDRSRFGRDDRTAGSLRQPDQGSSMRISSFSIPGLRIGRLNDADGVSPVLIPGNKQIVASPDYSNVVSNGGLPHEVIVFFQENSTNMEVGQLDVVNNDVLSILRKNPGLELEIRGFSEKLEQGPDATDKMAMARAVMVRDYLAKVVDDDRLTVTAKGDDTDVEPRDRVEMYFSR